jgi:hypothetical protein
VKQGETTVPKDESKHVKLYNQNAKVEGKTIEQWSEEWLRWVFHAPAAAPPGTPFGAAEGHPEGSPDNALVNNDGDVFFLFGGDWGNKDHPYTPVINAPADKPIFLPMINAFDIEGPGIETIPDFVEDGRGSYADEARFVTDLARKSIYDAHLTITRVGDEKPALDVHSPASGRFAQDTGTFTLGAPQANPVDYVGSLLAGKPGLADLPYTEEVGRWAMIKGLAPGDYVINFGGAGHAVADPVTGTKLFGGPEGEDWVHNTTDILHVT